MDNSLGNIRDNGVAPPQEHELHAAKAAHEKVYQQGSGDVSDEDLGKAAGVEAYHAYQKQEAVAQSEGESGGGQGQLIQMAMAEAMKLFSGAGGSDKSTVIQSAVAMAMKLFMGHSGAGGGGVSQLMSMFGGGGSSGGSSGGMGDMMGMLGQASQNPQVAGMLKQFF
ncbi:hypothetical protein EMPS_06098 [Entomortierella parvispora]|uniref:Beta-flanking protein n=1 Tax=Entomortierella parvispora TaxID=205924 RepID=A0A9P3HBM0_9FUNG|nr:hypothetical protein EMPS_06098 [Entomortierella parvispora]